jgi:hypothetical protein
MGSCYNGLRIAPPIVFLPSSTFPDAINLGDSTTYGHDHPEQSWRVNLQAMAGTTFHNASANGRSISDMIAAYPAEVSPFSPRLTKVPSVATVLIGNISLFQMTGEAAFAQKQTLLDMLREDWFYIVDMTVTPAASQVPGSQWDNRRLAYNALTQAGTTANFVFDTAALLPDPNNLTYYDDGTHYTQAGNQLIADTIFPAIKSALHWT